MAEAKVIFFTFLPEPVNKLITSYSPPGFNTVIAPRRLSEEELIDLLKDADFIMGIPGPKVFSERVLRAASRLKLIQVLSAGYDYVDLKLTLELGIPVANNGGANSWAVAEHAILLMLAVQKKLLLAVQGLREGRWRGVVDGYNTYELCGKMVGIVGLGNIGKKVARRVQAFETQVQYYDKYPASAAQERELGVKGVSLGEMLQTSDIITMHTPLTRETRHMIGREQLALMKPSAIIINTSRGGVIDEEALLEALREGKIAGAGLDVFEKEPTPPDNPLLKLDNVVATPHSAGLVWDTWPRRAEFAYQNMKNVWEGKPPQAVALTYED